MDGIYPLTFPSSHPNADSLDATVSHRAGRLFGYVPTYNHLPLVVGDFGRHPPQLGRQLVDRTGLWSLFLRRGIMPPEKAASQLSHYYLSAISDQGL